MHILRVCKRNGYSVFDLDYLFNCLMMSLFTYCIRVLLLIPNTLVKLIGY